MPASDLSADLDFALRLADAADATSLRFFDSADLDIEQKADSSFVTEADIATEKAIRQLIETERPEDGFFGEESGSTEQGRRQWIVDPIDGTHNYLRGLPMWGTLIALAIDGVPELGVVSQPALARRWWAATSHGAHTRNMNGTITPIHVSNVDDISRASISFQSIEQWEDAGRLDDLLALRRRVWRDRGYGDVWPYMMLAEGRLEFVGEFDVKEYDIAAIVPIVREAGGEMTDINGEKTISTRSSLASNGRLHGAFLEQLRNNPGQ